MQSSSAVASKILHWLQNEGHSLPTPGDVLHEVCSRLEASGIHLETAIFSNATLHPLIERAIFIWRPSKPWEVWYFQHNDVHIISDEELFSRQRNNGRVGSKVRYTEASSLPISEHYVHEESIVPNGISESHKLVSGDDCFLRFISSSLNGFTLFEKQVIERLLPYLFLALEIKVLYRRSGLVLSAYVGSEPADLILSGQIQRGDVIEKDAALLLCDLRGFTNLSNHLSSVELIDLLNKFFDMAAEPVERSGGEILKFLGDGMLVVFPVDRVRGSASEICDNAIRCAHLIEDATSTSPIFKREENSIVQAIHYGKVAYGNIGATNRLDFTVIGSDVNLLSRIETLCKSINKNILVSNVFSKIATTEFESVGEFDIRGFSEPQSVHIPIRNR